jgi:hypothetical protein
MNPMLLDRILALVPRSAKEALTLLRGEERDAAGEEAQLLRRARRLLERSVEAADEAAVYRGRAQRRRNSAEGAKNEERRKYWDGEAFVCDTRVTEFEEKAGLRERAAYKLLLTVRSGGPG